MADALQLIAQEQQARTGKLDLGCCGLTTLPDALFDCTWLEELYLGESYYDKEKKEWINSPNEGERNQLYELPPKMAQFQHLKALFADRNRISDISVLKHLVQLQNLDLNGNGISDISSLKYLTQLQTLDLGGNSISDISALQHLTQLQLLGLRFNKISDVSVLEHLTKLQTLSLRYNEISDISVLEHLTQLHDLDLRYNQISDISVLEHLLQLQYLYLNSNQISDISVLEHLSQLQYLDLMDNQISDIFILKHLTQLQDLYLSGNQISDISALKHLTQLESLNLEANQISDISPLLPLIEKGIPTSLKIADWYRKINIHDNPITTPPLEIVARGNAAILNYFEALKKGEEVALYEAKLLIIGEGGAGKTSLARRIKDEKVAMPKASTEGIDIIPYEFSTAEGDSFRVNIWDFGGQEIYHATHQFFLTKRSLYILLDDTLKDDKTVKDATFDYWLQVVELLSESSPVLIVQNEKSDRKKELDMAGIKKQFPNVLKSLTTNILTCRNLEKVRTALQYHIQQLPHIGNKLPKQWVEIRTALEQMASTKNYLSLEDYLEVCAKYEIEEEEKALMLSSYLHDLGAFLHFQDDLVLRDFFILRNDWATDAVYKVLDNPKVKAARGYFTQKDLEFIWRDKQYRFKQLQLLALMERFQLCFALRDRSEKTWLAPQLLPIETPDYEWNKEDNLLLRYRYGFMPKGLLSRFMVRTNHYVKDLDKAWRSGVFLQRENTAALVRETYGSREIRIRVKGAHPKELMTLIVEALDNINESYGSKLKVKKLIPCNCKLCKESKQPHFYDYSNLKRRKELGKRTTECEVSYEDISVEGLLDGVFVREMQKTPSDLEATSQKTIELFLASSNELKAERDAIEIFIRRENDRLAKKGIYLKLNLWEDLISAMSRTRKQDDYNEVILKSPIFISLFATKVGQYTQEEFETAYQNFKKGGTTQYIYTYFKNAQISTRTMNIEQLSKLDQFKKYLSTEGHFYDNFDDMNDLKLQLKTQLDKIIDK